MEPIDGDTDGIDYAPDGDGVGDACEGGSCVDPRSNHLLPMVGANYRCVNGEYAMEDSSRRVVREREVGVRREYLGR
jgi:hypothetical protein